MIEQPAHIWPIRVYFEDTDAGGIVYHASYLRFAERGRTEALRALQVPHQELTTLLGLIFVVRRIIVEYLSPARLDESLAVHTRVLTLGAASVTLHQAILGEGDVARAELTVTLVCIAAATGAPTRIPPRWRHALAGLVPATQE